MGRRQTPVKQIIANKKTSGYPCQSAEPAANRVLILICIDLFQASQTGDSDIACITAKLGEIDV